MLFDVNPQGGDRKLRNHDEPMVKGSAEWEKYFGEKNLKKGKKKPSESNELTTAIIKYIKLNGGAARRVNVFGRYSEAIGKWIPSGMKKGFEDISSILPIIINEKKYGLAVAIEVKIKKDSQNEHQIEREQEVIKAGGIYLIAKEFEQIKKEIDRILK